MKPALILSAALVPLLAAATAPATSVDAPVPPPDRVSTLIVFGTDPCPRSTGDDIVVCARQPENDRYRLPKRFRGRKKDAPADTAWGARVADFEYVGRTGMPNSCSPAGSGGQTGCFQQFITQARREREQARREAAEAP